MLNLKYTPNAFEATNNLVPSGKSQLYQCRHGLFQVVTENINRALGWNSACIMEVYGGVYYWEGGIFNRLCDEHGLDVLASLAFTGTRFMALTSGGRRQEKFFVGNGEGLYSVYRSNALNTSVSSVSLVEQNLVLFPTETHQLHALIHPVWAAIKGISWVSSDPAIVTVDENGLVTAVANGSATIDANTEDGLYTATCSITVEPIKPVTGLLFTRKTLTLPLNSIYQLSWSFAPLDATNQAVYFKSNDSSILIVSPYGEVTGKLSGTTTVTIISDDGSFSDTMTITIDSSLSPSVTTLSAPAPVKKAKSFTPRASNSVFYEAAEVVNTFLDENSFPYVLPAIRCLATWQNRLWAGDGSHIIYHCLNDDPYHWQPLDAIQIQGGRQSVVTGLCPMGDRLIVATEESIWQVTGNSPFNWDHRALVKGHGALNQQCLATDGSRLFYLDSHGLYQIGINEPLSEAIDPIFDTPYKDAAILLDAKGEYLYLLVHRRLFVMHTYTNVWGEIIHPVGNYGSMKGLVLIGGSVAVYGSDGLWVASNPYSPDVFLGSDPLQFGERRLVATLLKSWAESPNRTGFASLQRFHVNVETAYLAKSSYQLFLDSSLSEDGDTSVDINLGSYQPEPKPLVFQTKPLQKLYSERSIGYWYSLPLAISSEHFVHQLSAKGFVKYHNFDAVYQFEESEIDRRNS